MMMPPFRQALAIGLAAALLAPVSAHAWVKTYVVEWFEQAVYYGGPKDGGGETPGADCPTGINGMDWKKAIITPYRTPAQAEAINDPELWRGFFLSHIGFRGAHRENIYENPTSVPDPGLIQVSGNISEGFDLDDNPNTGFDGPNGEKGIDNLFYKVHGCILYYRSPPRNAAGAKSVNAVMHDGRFSIVFVFSGDKDPMNDDQVSVGVYSSKDKSVKDANGNIALDYTYRIDPDPNFGSVFRGKITNGVFESVGPMTFTSYDVQLFSTTPLILEKAKARFRFLEDGTVEGLVGGYRDFYSQFRLLAGNGGTTSGAIRENLGRFNMSGVYYALRREADGLPDPVTGVNRGMSGAYSYRLVPAIVLTPDYKMAVAALDLSRLATNNNLLLNESTEDERLAVASFEPITKVVADRRNVRRVTYRDPFAQPHMPNIVLEKTATGEYTYKVTTLRGTVKHEGKITAEEWNSVVSLDRALRSRPRVVKAKAEICYSKTMVIEATADGKAVRREASVCGGPEDTAAVLYAYKVAEVAVNHIGACRGFIESGREASWSLGECLRPRVGPPGPLSGGNYRPALGAN